ncbi:MAG: SPFH domain-containing protein [Nannocystales bacterium]
MVLETLIPLLVTMATILALALGVGALYGRMYIKVPSGQALIVNKMAEVSVFFTGGLAVPVIHKSEVMDISAASLVIERTGSQGLICKDGIRANLRATFSLRVNKTLEDVLRVAQSVGAERATQQRTLEGLFAAKFSQALESIATRKTFAEHHERRDELTLAVREQIGEELGGYTLDTLAIDRFEQTPIEQLDKNNILDAKGILAITKRTTAAQLEATEAQAAHHRRMKELETESKELLIELESRQASALLRLRKTAGNELTKEQLDDRLLDRLRELVDAAVEARLPSQT